MRTEEEQNNLTALVGQRVREEVLFKLMPEKSVAGCPSGGRTGKAEGQLAASWPECPLLLGRWEEAGKACGPHLVGQGLGFYSEGDRELLVALKQPGKLVKLEARWIEVGGGEVEAGRLGREAMAVLKVVWA